MAETEARPERYIDPRPESREDQPLRKMNSITRKLHNMIFRKKLAIYICFDFLIFFVLWFGWILDTELRVTGDFSFFSPRTFESTGGFWGIEYIVHNEAGAEILRENCSRLIFFSLVLFGSLVVIQTISVAIHWYGESKKIRQTLQPINEIALKADAMSKMTFSDAIFQTEVSSDASFQRLEEAIQDLDPEQDRMPSLGDQELQGIEAAMNNLLRRMHESYQQQARFVNDASHELRTPIAVIQGYANMLERWGREDEEVLNESITAITHEADHMHQLVEQLLFLARGDAGRTQLKEEPINPRDMMEEIYEESLMIDEKHKYHFKAPKFMPEVVGDPTLLKQAVRILVDNAAKYTKEGDDIYLSAGRTDGGGLYLQVQDSGIGMAEADVQHMFERFYRSDEARDIKGTGLGLAIAKWIIDRHKGHFEILSRTELGTRIRVVLPESMLRMTPSEDAPAEKETAASPRKNASTEKETTAPPRKNASAEKETAASPRKEAPAEKKTAAAPQKDAPRTDKAASSSAQAVKNVPSKEETSSVTDEITEIPDESAGIPMPDESAGDRKTDDRENGSMQAAAR